MVSIYFLEKEDVVLREEATYSRAPPVEGVLGAHVAAGSHLDGAWVAGRLTVAWYDPEARTLWRARADSDAPLTSADWTRDALAEDGRYPSVAVVAGEAAIAFYDAGEGRLRMARGDATHTIDADGNPGAFADLAVDGERAAVAYNDAASGALRVATATTFPPGDIAHWRVEVVDDEGDTGHAASVEWVAGRPVVAYHDATTRKLKVARRGDDAWTIEVVADESDADCDLAPSGELVAYRSATGDLMVARRGEEGWVSEPVDETGDVGHGVRVHTQFGRPVITHFDAGRHRLKTATTAEEGWRLDSVSTPEDVAEAAGFLAHPCGAVDDLGVGQHGGLHLYRAASGALAFVYDAEPSGQWTRHPVAGVTAAATSSVWLGGDLPRVAYGVRGGGVSLATATLWPPADSAQWERVAVSEEGTPLELSAVAGPALAWRDEASGAIHYARRGGEWAAHATGLRSNHAFGGLALVGGRPAVAYRDDDGAVLYARATNEAPAGPDDWSAHRVDPGVTGGTLVALVVVDGRPAVFYGDGEGGVFYAHATVPEPAGSPDWGARHAVTDDVDAHALAATVVGDRPLLLLASEGLHFLRARSADPGVAGDWQRHVADAGPVVGRPRLTERDGAPARLYGAAAPDSTLRLATTGSAAPGGAAAWTFGRVDQRTGPVPFFAADSLGDSRGQRAALYRVSGCAMLARAP